MVEKLGAVSIEDGKKKKKTRSKPGRHRMIKARVEQREKWQLEKSSQERMKEHDGKGACVQVEANKQKDNNGSKVYHPESSFYHAFLHLQSNFPHKVELPDAMAPKQTEIPFFNGLSRKLSFLMRHNLPKVGIPYRSVDGSASLEDVANPFQVSPIAIATASLPSEDGKRRMLLFETVVKGHQERRISALGGHGFAVFSPPGHWPISKTETSLFQMLIHETNNASEIQSSGFISGMSRFGGVNFTVSRRGGYRKKADALVTISSQNLAAAIANGFEFASME